MARASRSHCTRASSLVCALLAACLGYSTTAFAQAAPERVPAPGRSVASSDEGDALVVNPANLVFIPGAEARWTWVRTGSDSPSPARGHAFSFAGAFPFGLGTGIRMDFVRPPSAAPAPYNSPYTWLTWGLGLGGPQGGVGLSIQHLYSDDRQVGPLTSLSLGWSARPSKHLALGAVAHDVNEPRNSHGASVPRSYTLGAAIRPTGTRRFELGLEEQYYSSLAQSLAQSSHWAPRATLGLDVPYVGRVRGDVTVYDPGESSTRSYQASATLDLSSSLTTLTGGATWGSALGGSGGAGFITGLAISSWREPGVPSPDYALQIRMEDTPGTRSHVHFLRRLWKVSNDKELAAVVLHIKSAPASSLSHSDEIDDAVQLLQSRGKKVICHFEDAGGRALHACAHADRIVINPAGGIRFAGLSVTHTYLGEALNKLGVRAEFVRIGDYKSAPEQFTRSGPTEPATAMYRENLGDTSNELMGQLGQARGINPELMRQIIAAGPFTAREALRYHLVDGYAYDDELRTVVSEVVGHPISLREQVEPKAPRSFGRGRSVAIIYLDGNMVDGRSQNIPLLDIRVAGSYTIAQALKQAREDPSVGAVVFRIESPGGSSMAADVIWREASLTAKEKPLIVSMGSVAASGGYYAAAPAHTIYASPYTVTGSIGIFYGKADISPLLSKLGITTSTFRTSSRADAESVYRPFSPEEVQELGNKVKQFYDVFVDRVARGRHLTPAQVDAVARGRVWMGRRAQQQHLVDKLGGLRQALDEARSRAGLPEDAPIDELPPPEFSLLEFAASLASAQQRAEVSPLATLLPGQMRPLLHALTPFILYAPDQPMALSEISEAP